MHRCKSETVAVRDTDESQYEYYYQPVNHPDEATPVLRNHPNPHIEEIKQKQLDRITKRQGKRPTAKLHSKSLCNELLDESDYEVLSALRNTPAAQSPVWNELVQLPVERKERHQDNAANLESPGQDKPTSDLPTPGDENQSANNVSQAPTVSTLGRIRQKLSTFFHRKSVGPAILAPPPEAKSEPEDFYLEMWSQRELPELPDSEDSDDEDYDSIYNWVCIQLATIIHELILLGRLASIQIAVHFQHDKIMISTNRQLLLCLKGEIANALLMNAHFGRQHYVVKTS